MNKHTWGSGSILGIHILATVVHLYYSTGRIVTLPEFLVHPKIQQQRDILVLENRTGNLWTDDMHFPRRF